MILAPEVPYSHHVNTTIVCGISGNVVEGGGEDGGQLMALVSNVTGEARVYSKEVSLFLSSDLYFLALTEEGYL